MADKMKTQEPVLVEVPTAFRSISGAAVCATLVHSHETKLETIVNGQRVEGLFGPLDLIPWSPLTFAIGVIRGAITASGLLDSNLVQERTALVEHDGGFRPAAQIFVPDDTPQDVLKRVRKVVAQTFSQLMMTPGQRAAASGLQSCGLDDVQALAVKQVVEAGLAAAGRCGKLTKPLHAIVVDDQPIVISKLGKKKDLSDYRPVEGLFNGTVAGFVNDQNRSAVLFDSVEVGRIEADFFSAKAPDIAGKQGALDLLLLTRLNIVKARCVLGVTRTLNAAAKPVYSFLSLEEAAAAAAD